MRVMQRLNSRDVFSPLLRQTKAVVFYSTPHRGSPLIKNHMALLQSLFGFTPIMRELKGESPLLLSLSDSFLALSPRPTILSLGEEEPMRVGKYEAIVVPPASAKLDVRKREDSNPDWFICCSSRNEPHNSLQASR